MIDDKNRENEGTKNYEINTDDEATREARQGRPGEVKEKDDRLGHTPTENQTEEEKDDEE